MMELSVDEREQDEDLTALANQARAGSADAFDALARRVQDRVRRWAKEVTHDNDEADDVAQLVLLKLHAHVEQFEGRSRFTTWLFRVTRNLAFNRLHVAHRREALLARHAPELGEHDEPDRGAGSDARPALAALVHDCLAALPDRQREVFELGDLRGLNSTDIADRLGITPSTARGLLMKARRRMRLRMLELHPHLLEDYRP